MFLLKQLATRKHCAAIIFDLILCAIPQVGFALQIHRFSSALCGVANFLEKRVVLLRFQTRHLILFSFLSLCIGGKVQWPRAKSYFFWSNINRYSNIASNFRFGCLCLVFDTKSAIYIGSFLTTA